MTGPSKDRLTALRRELHRYPEPGWCEFRTSARIIEELQRMGVEEYYVGSEALDPNERLGVPDRQTRTQWFERAQNELDRDDILSELDELITGVVAVVDKGDGPTMGLRVDIDALPITESTNESHLPAAEGFRSEHDGTMHACGHDAHVTFGLGTLETVLESDFTGTFKVFFQPAEELLGGGKSMASGPHLDDVDHLYGVHIGLGHPTGEIVAGIDEPLALAKFDIEFQGESAHAGLEPNAGRNVVQAMSTAFENLYAIPRHVDGATRVNVGMLRTSNSSNVIADKGSAEAEVRGETTELMEYMRKKAYETLDSAASVHDCSVETHLTGEALRIDSDRSFAQRVADIANEISGVSSVLPNDSLGASEDFTYLMRAVKERGGTATFVGIGTDHPDGHHTPQFDIDEESLDIGVEVLSAIALDILET